MSPGLVALIMFGSLVALVLLRIPVSFALGLACIPVLIADARLTRSPPARDVQVVQFLHPGRAVFVLAATR